MKNLLFVLLLVPMVSCVQSKNDFKNSGDLKSDLGDNKGAIEDYSKAIELDPNYWNAYNNRANSKILLKDYNGAIADFTKTIELNPDFTSAYLDRGSSKEQLGDLNGACDDWKKAASLGDADADEWVRKKCN